MNKNLSKREPASRTLMAMTMFVHLESTRLLQILGERSSRLGHGVQEGATDDETSRQARSMTAWTKVQVPQRQHKKQFEWVK